MDKRLYQIALTQVAGLSCRSCRQMMEIYPDPEAIFQLSHKDLVELFSNHDKIINSIESGQPIAEAKKELEFVERYNIRVLFFTESDYPQRLNQPDCGDTPILLYMRGDCDLNGKRMLSVVGTRRATPYGLENTRRIIEQIREENVIVVSGLAYGIDTAAHSSALDYGLSTIGVLGHGLDQIYPTSNRSLAKKMIEHGGLVTEYPSGTKICPQLFPARNRIIAALSDATIVVEAATKGGALITAAIANSYHRDVFAVPGRLFDSYSAGCNNLIADNKAILIRNADDIFYILNWQRADANKSGEQQRLFPDLSKDEQAIYQLIHENGELTLDEIATKLQLSLPKIAAASLNMELTGIIKCLPGKKYVTM